MVQAPQNCVVEAKRQSNFGSRRVNVRTNKWKQAPLQRRTCGARMRAWQPSRLPLRTQEAVQRLSWCAVVVCQNFSNRRRKVIDAGTRHDDAVTAAVSFLSDAQESPAVVLPEFHVEMLALDLQFSRFDDVVHFSLRPPSLGTPRQEWKQNPHPRCRFLVG